MPLFSLSACFIPLAEHIGQYRCNIGRSVILHLGIDVHRDFAVFVTCEILYRLRVHAGMNQIRNVGVSKLMRCHLEIEAIYYPTVTAGLFTQLRMDNKCFSAQRPSRESWVLSGGA